jgi:GT2 family glycosyltransferase
MLSIIIVNYKTPQLLADCLTSVFQQSSDISFEVLVVDNASEDHSRELINELFPLIKWIQLDYNAGFARANNAGIRSSSGDTILLLNSDTIILENALNDCYKVLSDSHYVACGVQLLNRDGTPQISGNYFMTGGLNNLLPLPYLGPLIKKAGDIFKVRKPHIPDANEPVEVDWINGAFLMVKKSAIEKAGLMDEDFFLYAEEAEWCYRLGKVGKLVIYGQFKVIHLQGESSNAAFASTSEGYSNLYDKKGLQIMISNFVRIRKQFGTGWFLFQLIIYSINIPVFLIATVFRWLFSNKLKEELILVKKYAHNVVVVWSYSNEILMNRPYFYKIL